LFSAGKTGLAAAMVNRHAIRKASKPAWHAKITASSSKNLSLSIACYAIRRKTVYQS
jgi:hypothetical protein